MTPETAMERRANQIMRHADVYDRDPNFKMMVDKTVYLSQEEREKSVLYVDDVYGTRHSTFDTIFWQNKFGEGDAA